jgi:diketogulonate reductase-like aldo/keto reductase
MSHSIAPTIQLASGAKMPVLDLGTWQLTGGEAVGGVQQEALGQLNEHYASLAGLQYI